MKCLRQLALLLFLLIVGRQLHAGEVIDRIVATVEKKAILQSELDESVRFEAFSAGRTLDSIGHADITAALDRIIVQQLIRSAVGNSEAFSVNEEEVNKRLAELRSQVPEAATNDGWLNVLNRYGLTEPTVRAHLREQIDTVRLINQQIRPSVRIDPADIEKLYRDEFLPKLRQTGASDVPLQQVSGQIRQILVERQIGELVDSWVQNLRSEANVQVLLNSPGSTNNGSGKIEKQRGTAPASQQ